MTAAYAGASEVLARVRRRILTPRVPEDIVEFAARQIVKTSGGMERYDPELTPYGVGILRALADPAVRLVCLMMGSQTSKTEIMLTWLRWMIANAPRDAMMAYPSETLARRINVDRLTPSIRQTPGLREAERDVQTLELRFDRMTLYFVGAGTDTSAKSYPVAAVGGDEIDEFPDGFVELLEDRVKASKIPAKFGFGSTPTYPEVGIARKAGACHLRTYHVPCPHCRAFQAIEFNRIQWGVEEDNGRGETVVRGGSRCLPEEVERTAHMVCVHCGAQVDEGHKPWMLAHGQWAGDGERVEWDNGVAVRRGEPARDPSQLAFRLPSWYSPFPEASWGKGVRRFAEAGFVWTPEFVNGWCARPWEAPSEKIEVRQIRERIVPIEAGGHRLGEVPPGVTRVIAAFDVQADASYMDVRGFDADGRAWLLAYAKIPALPGRNLQEIVEAVREVDLRRLPEARERVGVNMVAVDSGHRAKEVYALCAVRRGYYAVKGFGGVARRGAWSWSAPITQFPDGRAMPGSIRLLHVNTWAFKASLLERYREGGAIRFPVDVGDDFLSQITSERMVSGLRHGKRFVEWRATGDNHYFDAEVYAEALYDTSKVRVNRTPTRVSNWRR